MKKKEERRKEEEEYEEDLLNHTAMDKIASNKMMQLSSLHEVNDKETIY